MTAGTGAVQEMRFLTQIGHRHGPAGFCNFSGNAFAMFIGYLKAIYIHIMGHIQPRFLIIAVNERYHPALHPETRTHFL